MTTMRGTSDLSQISQPSRVADEPGIGMDELGLAARNHGMPLEAMRYDVTPIGLHYLLTHFDIPYVDPGDWRLRVHGLVAHALTLDLDDIRSRPAVSLPVTMECAGNGRARLTPRPVSQPWLHEAVGTMEWTGTPLVGLLDDAGVTGSGSHVVFTGADHGVERGVEQDYQRGLTLEQAGREDVVLAYACNGSALPPQHGAPLRLIVPGWYGMASVKWLHSVEVVGEEFNGYQQTAYAVRQRSEDAGRPLTWIEPRALLVPPGSPDFMSRRRFLQAGRQRLEGRAWSGRGRVTGVEVTTDDGQTWTPAEVEPATGRWAWHRWTVEWSAQPGHHVLSARATDDSGAQQPDEAPWNRGGFRNNLPQRVEVLVLEG
jgi:sulfane dehydrogenase subunit SoxC